MDHLSENISELNQPFEAFLVTGDSLRSMTPERFENIVQMLRSLGLETTVIHEQSQEPPIPVSEADFLQFALEEKYTRERALGSWCMVTSTNDATYPEGEGLPAIRLLNEDKDLAVDLKSVDRRLRKLDLIRPYKKSYGWLNGSGLKVNFLAHMCNETFDSGIQYRF